MGGVEGRIRSENAEAITGSQDGRQHNDRRIQPEFHIRPRVKRSLLFGMAQDKNAASQGRVSRLPTLQAYEEHGQQYWEERCATSQAGRPSSAVAGRSMPNIIRGATTAAGAAAQGGSHDWCLQAGAAYGGREKRTARPCRYSYFAVGQPRSHETCSRAERASERRCRPRGAAAVHMAFEQLAGNG